ncbi:hypothetical protein [Actinomadura sp. 6N118]|uniref:hypothetical protein n=1 Tax=Actinomadura sp. 6N118 TaxID=3375151 RepID=UPI00379314C3
MNARLRQVVADKDELIASQDTLIRLQRDQLAGQDELLVEQGQVDRPGGGAERGVAAPGGAGLDEFLHAALG